MINVSPQEQSGRNPPKAVDQRPGRECQLRSIPRRPLSDPDGRTAAVQRERVKRRTIEHRRLQHRKLAA